MAELLKDIYEMLVTELVKIETKGGTPTTTSYTYDTANQLTAVDGQPYSYDANGNLVGEGEKTYVYNDHLLTE